MIISFTTKTSFQCSEHAQNGYSKWFEIPPRLNGEFDQSAVVICLLYTSQWVVGSWSLWKSTLSTLSLLFLQKSFSMKCVELKSWWIQIQSSLMLHLISPNTVSSLHEPCRPGMMNWFYFIFKPWHCHWVSEDLDEIYSKQGREQFKCCIYK